MDDHFSTDDGGGGESKGRQPLKLLPVLSKKAERVNTLSRADAQLTTADTQLYTQTRKQPYMHEQ